MLNNRYPDLVFVDCEASGIENPSYPIEVGLAWCDGRHEGHLVRPHPVWETWQWSAEAERIHKIPLSDLHTHGKDVKWVAEWVAAACEGKRVCSDNPEWEAYWLSQLFGAAGIDPNFAITHTNQVIKEAVDMGCGPMKFAILEPRVRDEFPHKHRASEDALYWAVLYREARQLAR